MIKRNSRRAVGFLFFMLVMFPVLLGALGLSSDFARLIVAYRQAADTADTLALAGAHAFNANATGSSATATLNVGNAYTAVNDTFREATGNKGRYPSMVPMLEQPTLSKVSVTGGGTKMTATVNYNLTGFIIVDYLAGKRNSLNFSVTRTAEICSSSNTQFCAYPTN